MERDQLQARSAESGHVDAITGDGPVKSTDGAATWNTINSGLPTGFLRLAVDPQNAGTINISNLVIEPQNEKTAYAGTWGGGVCAITFGADSVVTDLKFDRTSVQACDSFSANFSGPNLTTQTFFDVKLTSPGNNVSDVILNWQKGATASHGVAGGSASGVWTISAVRAHEIETDHSGSFVPVSATITVAP